MPISERRCRLASTRAAESQRCRYPGGSVASPRCGRPGLARTSGWPRADTVARHVLGRRLRAGRPPPRAHRPGDPQPARADERYGLRRDGAAGRRSAGRQQRQRRAGGGDHRRRSRLLLGCRHGERGPGSLHRGSDPFNHRPPGRRPAPRGDRAGRRPASAGDRGRQRRGRRRGHVPRSRLRHPHRLDRGLFPSRRHQQRPHRVRVGPQLHPASGDRLVPGLRHHADRTRRRRRRGVPHRPGERDGAARRTCWSAATRSAPASLPSAAPASSSPSECCGPAWKPPATRPTCAQR